MRKGALAVIFAAVVMMIAGTGCTGCAGKKGDTTDSVTTDSIATDSVELIDTVESIVESAPVPKAADELFDDFFFNFINNRKLQRARVKFPLRVTESGTTHLVQSGQWQMERFFKDQGYYTLIFDNAKQMNLVKDTAVSNVIVERILLQADKVEQFHFNRENGQWLLTEKKTVGLNESDNASFLTFLQGFFAHPEDSRHVQNPLPYYGPDPEDDEGKYLNMHIPAESWAEYLPEVPGEKIYNILYGQHNNAGSEKIFLFKGIANGLETQLKFHNQGGEWKLVEISL